MAQRACTPEWMGFSTDDQSGHPAQRFPIQVEPLCVLLRSDGEIQRAVAYLLDDLIGAKFYEPYPHSRTANLEGSDTFAQALQHGRQGGHANGDFPDLHILDVLSFELQAPQAFHGRLRMTNESSPLIGECHAFVRALHER